jgi:hypothetical protein
MNHEKHFYPAASVFWPTKRQRYHPKPHRHSNSRTLLGKASGTLGEK